MEGKHAEDIVEIEDTRPEYMKKRVVVPCITAIIFLICGIFYVIHSVYYKSTDDAFIEGHVITVAPRVAGPVLKLNIEDNQEVKKGDLLLEIDPKDYEAKLKETKAKLMGVNTKTTKEHIAIMDVSIEIENLEELNKVQKSIRKVDSVYEVRKKR